MEQNLIQGVLFRDFIRVRMSLESKFVESQALKDFLHNSMAFYK